IRDGHDVVVGSISMRLAEGPFGEATIGYGLDEPFRGRGFATAAVRLLAGWAFREVRVPRLVAGTLPDNLASQAVLRRTGFTREGVRRAALPGTGNTRRDEVAWSLLPEEY
ncbi:MAG: GNAT family N-acetyltransferase, partial [Stackebrandtia sp.]